MGARRTHIAGGVALALLAALGGVGAACSDSGRPGGGSVAPSSTTVGRLDSFRTVPLLGEPTEQRISTLLNGEVAIGSPEADLLRLVADGDYRYDTTSTPSVGFVHGASYYPIAVAVQDGRVSGYGVSPFECYDDESNM